MPPLDPDMLSEVYPFANARSKEDPAFRERAKQATVKLQEGHAGYRALWQELMRVSVADLKQNYEKLGVSFDLWYGESDSEQYIPELMQIHRKPKSPTPERRAPLWSMWRKQRIRRPCLP